MKVIRNDKNHLKFSQLKPGDTFIDPDRNCDYDPEMKIDYGDISYEFSDSVNTKENCYASVSLTTGNIFFYDDDFYVIPIKLNAVEE